MSTQTVKLELGENHITMVDPELNLLCTFIVTLGDDLDTIEVTPIELFNINKMEMNEDGE